MEKLLQRLELLSEADSKRDRDLRNRAVGFYEDLVKYLKKNKDRKFGVGPDGRIEARKFWADVAGKNLWVMFEPKQGSVDAAIHGSSDTWASYLRLFILPNKDSVLSGEKLIEKISKSNVVHELIHFLDPGILKGAYSKSDTERSIEYYNSNTEWNAYWQMGAEAAEDSLRKHMMDGIYSPSSHSRNVQVTTYEKFRQTVIHFWRSDWLEALNDENQKKFEKRMYQLWLDWEKWFKRVAKISDDIGDAVNGAFEDVKDEMKPPVKTAGGKIRHSQKREEFNASIVVDAIKKRLGGYQKYLNAEEVKTFLTSTYHPQSYFTWNPDSFRIDTTAGQIALPIIRRAVGGIEFRS